MTTVHLLGWSPGLNKVRLTKLIRSSTAMPLNEAQAAVNRLLAGEVIELRFDRSQAAQQLAVAAHALGVQVECVSAPESSTVTG